MKYLIIGDVHADLLAFENAVNYAAAKKLTLISVGDLIDNCSGGPGVVKTMIKLLEQDRAQVVIGNHEWKIYRWAIGNPVKITPPNQITVDQMSVDVTFKNNFLKMMSYAKDYIKLTDKLFVTHAAIDPEFWNNTESPSKKQLEIMKYGSIDHKSELLHYRGETYNTRLYDWINNVPAGVTLFVGHDPRPLIGVPDFDNFQIAPLVHKNANSGVTVFLDCGSGKGGTLWGAVVNTANNSIEELRNFSV